MGRGWVRGRVRVSVYDSSIVSGIFRGISIHNLGTTRGPHQIARFLYFILEQYSWVW